MGFRLTWTDNNLGEDGHKVYRSDSTMDPQALPAPIAVLGADVVSYDDGDVVDGQTYYYRVSAYTSSVEKVSEEISAGGTPPSTGIQGCVEFTGVDTYFDCGNLVSAGSAAYSSLTVECRCTFYDLAGYYTLFEDGGSTRGFAVGIINNSLRVAVNNSGAAVHQEIDYPVSNLAINTPYHIAAIFDGPNGILKLYVDGINVVTSSGLSTFTDYNGSDRCTIGGPAATGESGSPLKNGAVVQGSEGNMSGRITEMRMWDGVRSEAQIAANKELRLLGSEPNLLHYWPMNEGSGTQILDNVGVRDGVGNGGYNWLPGEFT